MGGGCERRKVGGPEGQSIINFILPNQTPLALSSTYIKTLKQQKSASQELFVANEGQTLLFHALWRVQ